MEVEIKKFAFTNTGGGTGLSDWQYNEKFHGVARVTFRKGWFDYETGYRFIGEACSYDLNLYLDRNASLENRSVYFGEQDLVDRNQLQCLLDMVNGTVNADDGAKRLVSSSGIDGSP